MLKRIFDIFLSLIGLIIGTPFAILAAALIWFEDFRNPFYLPMRIGKGGRPFKMYKLRSMFVGADASGVDSTSKNDHRITKVGRFMRMTKIDEVPQLLNVVIGDMSLVGPRPNIESETKLYTALERDLLKVRPGITDISSIVFSDLNNILSDSSNPNLDYNQLVRPWKSRLGLFYIAKATLLMDFKLIFYTFTSVVNREWTLNQISKLVLKSNGENELAALIRRNDPLIPVNPPGRDKIVTSEEVLR